MTFEDLTLEILKTLIPKSGVREWEDEQARQDLTFAAMQMAATILGEGETMPNDIYIDHGTTIVFGSELLQSPGVHRKRSGTSGRAPCPLGEIVAHTGWGRPGISAGSR